MTRLYEHSATALVRLIRSGDVSSREVVEAHLARIDEVNGVVNAIAVPLAETALAAADDIDRGAKDKPLSGVPFTIKESIDCLGSATTFGVRRLAHAMPYVDAPVVERMRAAGAIPLARTNLSEMGMRLSTDNPLRGATRNPWMPELTVGGSSGGDAAALATGMTPLALGNDIGGSLRSPAYCAGIASLKPTLGRIPHASSLPPRDLGFSGQAMLVQGPMARTVADLRVCLSVLAGRDIRDPRSVDVPLAAPALVRRRAALVTGADRRVPGSTVAAIERAGETLAAAGWDVDRADPPEWDRVNEVWMHLFAIDLLDTLASLRPLISPSLYGYLRRLCAHADPGDASERAVHAERSRLQRAWSAFFADYPVLIAPTWGRLPWPIDADLDPTTGIDLVADTAHYLLAGSALGMPSVALPMGVVDGLPTGIQIVADLWAESTCLDVAAIVEAAVGSVTPIDPVGYK